MKRAEKNEVHKPKHSLSVMFYPFARGILQSNVL